MANCEKLKISRILHAGYIFQCGESQIAFDPIFENPFSRNCYAFPEIRFDVEKIKNLKFSAVFISHYHDDHCSMESLDLLDRATPIYLYCVHEELFTLIRELGFRHVHQLRIDTPVRIGSMEIIPRRALDEDVDSIFHVKAAGLNILNVVDSWIDPSTMRTLASYAPWDLVLWPFQTMREIEVLAPSRALPAPKELPAEWMDQLKILNPKYVVPSSCQFLQERWSWYNHAFFPVTYHQFRNEVETVLPTVQVVQMNPSVSVVLGKNSLQYSSSLSWILPIGEQDVDYDYRPNQQPPTTAEISRRFSPLTNEQTERVLEYCAKEILEKYQSMAPPADGFFAQSRFWRLSIFDHRGEVRHFHYNLIGSKMNSVRENSGTLSWITEVPISKLYAALELGESLTSMYLRINDMVFESDIEKSVNSVDIIEDPLIRCLFNGVFGAYQKAQLKKIQQKSKME